MGKVNLRPSRAAERTSSRPRVLAINSYAGSLLVAARSIGADIAGSYEDAGFGSAWQRKNFPELDGLFASDRRSWPVSRLDDTVVIAHPPCAAFSTQAKGTHGEAHGLKSHHFACTIDVGDYALGHRCAALLIESVQPALEGGREAHDMLAAKHGYRLFRVLQNAATFGCPQWRPRFWAVYVRKDLAERLALVHEPDCKTVGAVLAAVDPGEPNAALAAQYGRQKAFLAAQGVDPSAVDGLMWSPGKLVSKLRRHLESKERIHEISRRYCLNGQPSRLMGLDAPMKGTAWVTETLTTLDPQGPCPVIMHNSWFGWEGRSATPREYKALMGFPPDYELDGHEYRMWLSKGVCPPVAASLLDQVMATVEGKRELPLSGVHWCEDGGIADLQMNRDVWDTMAGAVRPKEEDRAGQTRPDRRRRPVEHRGDEEGDRGGVHAGEDPAQADGPQSGRAIGDAQGQSQAQPRLKAPRKKRVVLSYEIVAGAALTREILEQAFASQREVVAPPLESILALDGPIARVRAQYEPPNSGGHSGDVDRILARVVRKLEAEGLGPVQYRRT